jgi:hypothetical protein
MTFALRDISDTIHSAARG